MDSGKKKAIVASDSRQLSSNIETESEQETDSET